MGGALRANHMIRMFAQDTNKIHKGSVLGQLVWLMNVCTLSRLPDVCDVCGTTGK